MIYCFDLDGTICTSVEKSQYEKALPDCVVVNEINRLYDEGNIIKIMTARGCVSGVDHTHLTKKQLREWGVKYHELLMHIKPHAHWFIDDKGIHVSEWKSRIPLVKGIIAGAFDVIHPGYIRMFRDAKMHCNHLTVALHFDPSTERSHKLSPVHTVEERKEILLALKDVDDVVLYSKEEEFLDYLKSEKYNYRFLGTDYLNQNYTGKDINIPIIWLDRKSHNYSSTRLKNLIYESVSSKKLEFENYD
jgi:glycerol-3-phosphate cytidylyltransferase